MITLVSNNPQKPRSLKKNYGVQSQTIGSVPANYVMTSVQKKVVTIGNIHEFQDGAIGDIWHEVHGVPLIGLNGTYNGKIAEKHKGETLLTATDTGSNPVPDPTTPPISTIVEAITFDFLENARRIVIYTSLDIDEVIVGNNVYHKSPPVG